MWQSGHVGDMCPSYYMHLRQGFRFWGNFALFTLQFWCYLFFMHWLVGEGSKTSFIVYIALKCFVDRTTFNLSFPFILCILQRHTKVFCTAHHIQSFLFYAALAASRTGKQPAPRQNMNLFHINPYVSPSLGKPLFEKCPAQKASEPPTP